MPLNGPNATTWSKDRPGPGRTPGAKNKLQAAFLRDLTEAWELEGKGCLRIMAKEEPSKFVQVCAGLMPREVMFDGGLVGDLSDEEIELLITKARQQLLAGPKQEPKSEPKLVGSEKV